MIHSSLIRLPALVLLLTLAACETRSISNSGYPGYYGGGGNALYRGELNELEVLGFNRAQAVTDEIIQQAFVVKAPIMLKQESPVMLIQSGAMFPDEQMMKPLAVHYTVGGFSGVPNGTSSDRSDGTAAADVPYPMALRLVAAKGGYETIVVYWGILETAQENFVTKAVSWVPIVGGVIPDESQRMRIRLKVAVIDVKSGHWEMFAPEPLMDEAISGSYGRVASDQAQVDLLKEDAYKAAVQQIVDRYSG
jgi:hypothetical protein